MASPMDARIKIRDAEEAPRKTAVFTLLTALIVQPGLEADEVTEIENAFFLMSVQRLCL